MATTWSASFLEVRYGGNDCVSVNCSDTYHRSDIYHRDVHTDHTKHTHDKNASFNKSSDWNIMTDSPFLVARSTSFHEKMFSSGHLGFKSQGLHSDGFDQELWKKKARIIELYVIGLLIAAGVFGNILSVMVLKRDRQRRESLFLLRILALADLLYLVFATFRYPVKHILPLIDPNVERNSFNGATGSSPLYVHMQPIIFPCLKTTQTVTIWMTVLVAVDRFAWVRFPQNALKRFNAVTRKRYALLVCLFSILYNFPRFLDSKVFQLNLPCFSDIISTQPPNKLYDSDWLTACLDLKNFEPNLSAMATEIQECGGDDGGGDDGDDDNDGGGDDNDGGDDGGDDNDGGRNERHEKVNSSEIHDIHDSMQDERTFRSEEDQQYNDDDRTDATVAMTTVAKVDGDAIEFTSVRPKLSESFVTFQIETEKNSPQVIPVLKRCLKRTIMSYRLDFTGPIYHNLYLDGMYLTFLYLLPLISITCINFYLVYAIRTSRMHRHHQCYYASFKFANNNKTPQECQGDRCHTIKSKNDFHEDDGVIQDPIHPNDRQNSRFSVWQTIPRERRNNKRATCSGCRHHDCSVSSESCSSLIYSHNHNYLQQFQQHSLGQKNPHIYHQQCHCYSGQNGRRKKETNQHLRSDSARHHQVTFNVDSKLKHRDVERLAKVNPCQRQPHSDGCHNVKRSRQVAVWIPFRGSRPTTNLTSDNFRRPIVRLSGSELNATVVLIVVVATFVACESLELVLRAMTFTQRNIGLKLINGERLAALSLASELSMVLKSTLNFLIYVVFGRRFRSFLRKVCPIRFPSSTSFGSSPMQKQATPQII